MQRRTMNLIYLHSDVVALNAFASYLFNTNTNEASNKDRCLNFLRFWFLSHQKNVVGNLTCAFWWYAYFGHTFYAIVNIKVFINFFLHSSKGNGQNLTKANGWAESSQAENPFYFDFSCRNDLVRFPCFFQSMLRWPVWS